MEPPERPSPFDPLRTRSWLNEAQRKSLHLAFILLPLCLLHEWLPWPRAHSEWRLLLLGAVALAILLDLVRVHDDRVRGFFRRFFGEMIREHEEFNLLGSTYLLLASLLAIELFPRPLAAATIGFVVLGDGIAALAGKAFGRTRFFKKSLEGAAGGLLACLAWGSYLALSGYLPWGVAMTGALVASLIELLPIPLDDNLGITLFAGYAMKLLTSA